MKVILKSKLSDATASLLKGAQRNAYPQSEQRVALKKNELTGKFITGYDISFGENYEQILKDKKHPKYELMLERQRIEEALSVSLDGDKDNEFLLNTRIPLCNRKTVDIELNLAKPRDLFYYRALIANGFVAATKEDIYGIGNRNVLYYFSSPIKEESSRQFISKTKNYLSGKISTFETNKVWLLAISNKLSLPCLPDLSTEALYNNLDDLKNKINTKLEAEKLQNVFDTDLASLQFDFVIDMAFKNFIIENGANGSKMVNGTLVGTSIEEATVNLKTEKYSDSFAFIMNKVFDKYKLK